MTDERRQASIENVLVEIGHIKGIAERNASWLQDIDTKITIQNSRVGKLEGWRSFVIGALTIVNIIVIPIAIIVLTEWVKHGSH